MNMIAGFESSYQSSKTQVAAAASEKVNFSCHDFCFCRKNQPGKSYDERLDCKEEWKIFV